MNEHFRMDSISSIRGLCLVTVFLALFGGSNPCWCQTGESPKAQKEAAKNVAKARSHAQNDAYNAIGHGKIDKLKAILQANPDIAYLPLKTDALATVVGATAGNIALVGSEGLKQAEQDAPRVDAVAVEAGRGVTLLHWAAWFNRTDAA